MLERSGIELIPSRQLYWLEISRSIIFASSTKSGRNIGYFQIKNSLLSTPTCGIPYNSYGKVELTLSELDLVNATGVDF